MNTKKKLYLSICLAIYGLVGVILYPLLAAQLRGWDSKVNNIDIAFIIIDLILCFIGIIMSIVYVRRLSKEKIKSLNSNYISKSENICRICKINLSPKCKICPKCGNNLYQQE